MMYRPFIPEKTTATELIDIFIWKHITCGVKKSYKIGQCLEELDDDMRAVLATLKSSDLSKMVFIK
jgi:hypothetical protein